MIFKVGGIWERTLRTDDYHWRIVNMLIRKVPAPKMNPQRSFLDFSNKEKAGTWKVLNGGMASAKWIYAINMHSQRMSSSAKQRHCQPQANTDHW